MDANETALRSYTATADDVAAHFGVSSDTVLRWTRTTDIPHRRVRTGQKTTVRFNLPEVDSWAARGGRPSEVVTAPADPAA